LEFWETIDIKKQLLW